MNKAEEDKRLQDSEFYRNAFGYEQATNGNKTDQPERIAVVDSLDGFLTREFPPREMMLEPVLVTQGITLVYAYRGVGKTHVSIGLAYAAATGGPFLRWHAEKPWPVLFVDGELPAALLQTRLARKVESEEEECDPEYFRIITPDRQEAGIPSVATPEGQRFIEDQLRDTKLLVLDNLSTLCRTGDENSAESWQPVQQWLLKLRTQGVSTLLMHHSGKLGQQRGTSNREDVIDVSLKLKHPSDYTMEEGARFECHYEKARDAHGNNVAPFEAQLTEADGKDAWTVKGLEETTLNQVVQLSLGGLSQREIAKEIGMAASTVNRKIQEAKKQGKL